MSRFHPETLLIPASARAGADHAPAGTRAVVVGGGIAGVAAAALLCERGVQVTLIEREAQLGGRAGGFEHTLRSGERLQMERGFHAFFRQYYNLRALLRRIDPELSLLAPLADYPILGPSGEVQSFRGLPKRTPLQIMALTWKTPYLRLTDLLRVNAPAALEMLRFDSERTYQRFDHSSAATYLDSLAFPELARRMLFEVFSHSFFNPEGQLSAAELLMMFHFYFTGNGEGLIFDVVSRPLTAAIWQPFLSWLRARGVLVLTDTTVERVDRATGEWRVQHSAGSDPACGDDLVLALDVAGLKHLVQASPALSALSQVQALELTRPFAVLRLWLDGRVRGDRAPFAGTTGVGLLDNISVYELFQDESAAWTRRHGGSVVELHAYAVSPELDEAAVRADLLSGMHTSYPETRALGIVDECMLIRRDCPAFPPGSRAARPTPATSLVDVALAGDFVALPFPCALMERAAASGFIAANTLLARHGVRAEPVVSVPRQGLFSPSRFRFGGARRDPREVLHGTSSTAQS